MNETTFIKKLSEILAEALATRPELIERLSTLLGSRRIPAAPGKAKRVTKKVRYDRIMKRLTESHVKDQLRKVDK